MTPSNEPVAIGGLINTALGATIAILLYLKVDHQLVAAITLAATGWVTAIAAVVRSKVTPTKQVALTHAQVADIKAGQVPLPAPGQV